MKNIHILPTDKPSKGYVLGKCIKNLSDVKIGQFTKTYYLMFDKEYFQPQNIYIISDEEIKEGTWSMSLCDDESYEEIYQCKKANLVPIEDRKIILTTDQDLIKDGVQAIDNEFLEWFVKNPSCEFVEVRKEKYSERFDNDKSPIGNPNTWGNRWLIIIPKEEQKKILIDMMKDDEELGLYDDIKVNRIKLVCKDCSDSLEDCTCIVSTIDFPRQEIKLEEVFNDDKKENIKKFIDEINNPSQPNDKLKQAFEKYSEYLEDYENKNTYEHGFKDGAKWQQERSYSEEEVTDLLYKRSIYQDHFESDAEVREWFEKFKKK